MWSSNFQELPSVSQNILIKMVKIGYRECNENMPESGFCGSKNCFVQRVGLDPVLEF